MRKIALASLVLALSGCAAMMAQSEVYEYSGHHYVARRGADDIRIFDGEKPAKAYVQVAKIVVRQGFGSKQYAYEELRRKAAEIGADAVINLQMTREQDVYGDHTIQKDSQTEYEGHGTETHTETHVSEPTVINHAVFSGVAIRYKSADEKDDE